MTILLLVKKSKMCTFGKIKYSFKESCKCDLPWVWANAPCIEIIRNQDTNTLWSEVMVNWTFIHIKKIIKCSLVKKHHCSQIQYKIMKLTIIKRITTKPINKSLLRSSRWKKQSETLFRMICCERKTLFGLKKQAEKDAI